jgi:hypothetical protein
MIVLDLSRYPNVPQYEDISEVLTDSILVADDDIVNDMQQKIRKWGHEKRCRDARVEESGLGMCGGRLRDYLSSRIFLATVPPTD